MSDQTDPNEEHDKKIAAGKDRPAMSVDELIGAKLNPVRETQDVAANLRDKF